MKKLIRLVYDMTYLVLGCEAVRNPASFITHQMALDLVAVEKLTIQKLLYDPTCYPTYEGGKLPMSMGANDAQPVKSARFLQQIFAPYMPHPYSYPGEVQKSEPKCMGLVKRELYLAISWFRHFKPDPLSKKEAVVAALEEKIAEWYPPTP